MSNTIESLEKNKCSGCGACFQKCPRKSIDMIEDQEGFPYPSVNKNTCINCGLCAKVCPQLNDLAGASKENAFAFCNTDENIINKSSSGGAFTYLANEIIRRGGVVYGSASDYLTEDGPIIHHIRVDSIQGIEKLRGSKYVYSVTEFTYEFTRRDLEDGIWVLYTGTPCQIAGLKGYLSKDYDKLITCEILCHGAPNQKLFKRYINKLEQELDGKVLSYNFRSKVKGWGLFYLFTYKDNNTGEVKTKFGIADEDPYYISFLKGKTYRESCYQCKYARRERIADITIGDYWGVELEHPEFADVHGVSAIMPNTDKGVEFFESIKEKCKMIEISRSSVEKENHNLYEPTKRPADRDYAYQRINNSDPIFNYPPYIISKKQRMIAFIKKHISVEQKWRLKRLIKKTNN